MIPTLPRVTNPPEAASSPGRRSHWRVRSGAVLAIALLASMLLLLQAVLLTTPLRCFGYHYAGAEMQHRVEPTGSASWSIALVRNVQPTGVFFVGRGYILGEVIMGRRALGGFGYHWVVSVPEQGSVNFMYLELVFPVWATLVAVPMLWACALRRRTSVVTPA